MGLPAPIRSPTECPRGTRPPTLLPDQLVGLVHLGPEVQPRGFGKYVCIGISGYWAGDGGTPRFEDSPVFSTVADAVEWGIARARVVYLKIAPGGALYRHGTAMEGEAGDSIELNLSDAEREFQSIFGHEV